VDLGNKINNKKVTNTKNSKNLSQNPDIFIQNTSRVNTTSKSKQRTLNNKQQK